jgi:hypothetical protein
MVCTPLTTRLTLVPQAEVAVTLWQWWRNRRAAARAKYAYQGPGRNDAAHTGTFGQIWFQHAYSVEAQTPTGPWRATCKCGYRGRWEQWKITAEIDAEYHPMNADWMWDK